MTRSTVDYVKPLLVRHTLRVVFVVVDVDLLRHLRHLADPGGQTVSRSPGRRIEICPVVVAEPMFLALLQDLGSLIFFRPQFFYRIIPQSFYRGGPKTRTAATPSSELSHLPFPPSPLEFPPPVFSLILPFPPSQVHSRHSAYNNPPAKPDTPTICWKHGSLQKFAAACESMSDFSSSCFTADQVHRIGILDIRLLNMDRNEGNVLIDQNRKMIPIDHGLCLPDRLDVTEDNLLWMSFPQAKQEFSPESLEFIASLDFEWERR